MGIVVQGGSEAPLSPLFWDAGDVLDMARAIVNDMQVTKDGDLLSNTQPYTWILLNLAYANLQEKLADSGVESVSAKEMDVDLPASPSTDVAAQVRLGYDGYWDAVNDVDPDITLPPDMLMPMSLYERPTGGIGGFLPISESVGSMPSIGCCQRLGIWEFRENSIFFPACRVARTVRHRYVPSLPDLVQPGEGEPMPQVPLARAGQVLAYAVAAEYLIMRSAKNAPIIAAKVADMIEDMANRSAKRLQGAVLRRPAYGGGFWRRR